MFFLSVGRAQETVKMGYVCFFRLQRTTLIDAPTRHRHSEENRCGFTRATLMLDDHRSLSDIVPDFLQPENQRPRPMKRCTVPNCSYVGYSAIHHSRQDHSKPFVLYKCPLCEYNGTSKKHQERRHPTFEQARKCGQCEKFLVWWYLPIHVRRVHKPAVLCNTCKTIVASRQELREHNKLFHTEKYNIKCSIPECDVTMRTSYMIRKHVEHCHTTFQMCVLCKRPYKSISHHMAHIHKGESVPPSPLYSGTEQAIK